MGRRAAVRPPAVDHPPTAAQTLTLPHDDAGGGDAVEIQGLDSAVGMAFGKLGLAMWTVPAVAMGVPGLLVLVVVLVQLAGGAAWVPVTRRALGSLGVRRRKRRGGVGGR